jgi:predicted glutamine amidotransferase
MCRLLGWVARDGLSLRDVLGEESFVAFAQLSRIHADGWGVAYADANGTAGRLEVERSTTNASADPAFTAVATGAVARAGLAHLRWASPGLPVELCNAHPFRWGQTAFAHNGGIYPFDRVGELLSDSWRAHLTGTTDSEHFFLAVMAEMTDSGDDLPTALPRVMRRIAAGFSPSSLNAMFLAPEALYVVNCHDPSIRPVLPPAEVQSVDEMVEATEEAAPYYDLRYRRTGTSVVVASSGFAQPEGGGWRRMENNTLLVVDRATLEVTEIPLDVRIGLSAAAGNAGADLR